MNKILSLITVLLIMLTSLYSCNIKRTPNLLINKWKLEKWTNGKVGIVPDSFKNEFIKNASIEFEEGNRFNFTRTDSIQHEGTYTLSKDQKVISVNIPEVKRSDEFTIVELSGQKFTNIDKLGNKFSYTLIHILPPFILGAKSTHVDHK
jgi:hypothetical protein